ncbi:MAG: hypothetical protein PHP33_03830, partial [Bacteroidales bacterium]|nr:hypothetical protein [Bacteroidales bacterium]
GLKEKTLLPLADKTKKITAFKLACAAPRSGLPRLCSVIPWGGGLKEKTLLPLADKTKKITAFKLACAAPRSGLPRLCSVIPWGGITSPLSRSGLPPG